MAQFTVYRSTDASAPTLSGTAGDMTNLLKKILVNGYGSKSAAGWTNPFSGAANQEVFRQGGGNQFYLQIDDAAPGTGGARAARAWGYENMSAYNTGLASGGSLSTPFPTAAQRSAGVSWDKSITADATTRTWVAFADDRTLYLFVYDGQTGSGFNLCRSMMFGDFYSLVSSDGYRTAIQGSTVEVAGADANNDFFAVALSTTGVAGGAQTGHWMARNYVGGVSGSQTWGKITDDPSSFGGSNAPSAWHNAGTNQALNFPNNADGGLYLAPYYIVEPTAEVRGRMRGVYFTPHIHTNFADGQTFTGTGDYAGKTFVFVKGVGLTTTTFGGVFIETSATLETN